jgi:hypothetical protein
LLAALRALLTSDEALGSPKRCTVAESATPEPRVGLDPRPVDSGDRKTTEPGESEYAAPLAMAAAPGANICSKDISRELIRSAPDVGSEGNGAPNPAAAGVAATDGEEGDELSRWSACWVGESIDVRCNATRFGVDNGGLECPGPDDIARGTPGPGRLRPVPSSGALACVDLGAAS